MDWMNLLQQGAALIQQNADPNTDGLDTGRLTDALAQFLGGESGELDIGTLVQRFQEGGLGDIVQSWIGEGENAPVAPEQVEAVLGRDQIQAFAEKLGVPADSAAQALADALPALVDRATSEDSSLAQQLLEQVGGLNGALDMLKKLF